MEKGKAVFKMLHEFHNLLAELFSRWALVPLYLETFEFSKINDLPYAASALPSDREEFAREFGFPLVVKPREGYGSVHFNIVKNKEEMDFSVQAIEKAGWHAVIQEFLAGDEFTTGITVDTSGNSI